MSKMFGISITATLIVSALALSACASKPEPVSVAEPAPPPAVIAEKPPAPEVTPGPTPVPAVVAEQPAVSAAPVTNPVAKPVTKHKRIVAKHAAPKAPPPMPVVAPTPAAPVPVPVVSPPEPKPSVPIAPPAEKMTETSFLERYWLWLLGLAIVIGGVFAWLWKAQEGKR